MITLVDTNVVSYILGNEPDFAEHAALALEFAGRNGRVCINQIVYAELTGYVRDRRKLDDQLAELCLERDDLPWDAAPAAAEAFRKYRAKGGPRPSLLPDFYIGAHALVRG
jgi:predicted nucleic acid-binding protein